MGPLKSPTRVTVTILEGHVNCKGDSWNFRSWTQSPTSCLLGCLLVPHFGEQNENEDTSEFFDEKHSSCEITKEKQPKNMRRIGRSKNIPWHWLLNLLHDAEENDDDTTVFGTIFAFMKSQNEISWNVNRSHWKQSRNGCQSIMCLYYDVYSNLNKFPYTASLKVLLLTSNQWKLLSSSLASHTS